MSLLNQPTFKSGTYFRKIDTYLNSSSLAVSQVLPIGTNISSCQFATSDSSVITITEAGKYRVFFSSYVNFLVQGGANSQSAQFRLESGGTIFAISEVFNTTFSNNFNASLFYDYNGSSLSGALPNSPANGGLTINANLSASVEMLLNVNDQVRMYVTKTQLGVSPIPITVGVNGYFILEQIS